MAAKGSRFEGSSPLPDARGERKLAAAQSDSREPALSSGGTL